MRKSVNKKRCKTLLDNLGTWTKFLEEYKEYFKDNYEIWNEKFEELKMFINKNKKTPTVKENKILNTWLSKQNYNYKTKKHSMIDETIYNLCIFLSASLQPSILKFKNRNIFYKHIL